VRWLVADQVSDSPVNGLGPRQLPSRRGWPAAQRLFAGLVCLGVGIAYLIGPPWATGVLVGGPALAVGTLLVVVAALLGLPVVADLASPGSLTLDDRGMTERVPLRGTRFYPWKVCRWFWVWQPMSVSPPERFQRVAVDFGIIDDKRSRWRRGGHLRGERRLLHANYGAMSASELARLLNRYQYAYGGPGLTYHDVEEEAE
jgi:hypothetical protein